MARLQWILILLVFVAFSPININIAIGQSDGAFPPAALPSPDSPPEPTGDASIVAPQADHGVAAGEAVATDIPQEPEIAAPVEPPQPPQPAQSAEPAAGSVEQDGGFASETPAESARSDEGVSAEVASDQEFSTIPEPPPEVRNLSVEPGMRPLMPEDCPAWISAPPDFVSSVHRMTVSSIPTSNLDRVDESLDEPLLAALYGYIDDQLLGEIGGAQRIKNEVSVSFIRKNLIDDPEGYVATLSTSTGPMYQKWVTVTVTPEQRSEIQVWCRESMQRERIAPIGLGVLAGLGLIGLTHLVLRRRHGMPKTNAMSAQQVANFQSEPVGTRRSGLAGLALFACIMILPAGLVLSGLFLVQSREIRSDGPIPQAASEVMLVPKPAPPRLHIPKSEVKLNSGNKVIIIRTE